MSPSKAIHPVDSDHFVAVDQLHFIGSMFSTHNSTLLPFRRHHVGNTGLNCFNPLPHRDAY